MVIVEFPNFTRAITELLSDDEYAALQQILAYQPDTGDLIPGCGGLRKLRWKQAGKGKRGGIRVIYYWLTAQGRIFMLAAYPKSKQDDLSEAQKRLLVKLIEEALDNG